MPFCDMQEIKYVSKENKFLAFEKTRNASVSKYGFIYMQIYIQGVS